MVNACLVISMQPAEPVLLVELLELDVELEELDVELDVELDELLELDVLELELEDDDETVPIRCAFPVIVPPGVTSVIG